MKWIVTAFSYEDGGYRFPISEHTTKSEAEKQASIEALIYYNVQVEPEYSES